MRTTMTTMPTMKQKRRRFLIENNKKRKEKKKDADEEQTEEKEDGEELTGEGDAKGFEGRSLRSTRRRLWPRPKLKRR